MKTKTHLFLFILFFGIVSANAQNPDPHGTEESSITGMVSSEKIWLVLDITAHDSLQYQKYQLKVKPLIEKHGGVYLVRAGEIIFDSDPNRKVVLAEGNWNPNQYIILQWESMEQLEKFTTSEEYKTAVRILGGSALTKSSIIVKE